MKSRLELITTGDERSRKFEDYMDFFGRRYPEIEIHTKKDEGAGGPAILILPNIQLAAVPTEKWEPVFLAFLESKDSFPNKTEPVKSLNATANIKLYIAPFCPFCPRVISDILPLVSQQPLWQLTIIDGEMFPEMASADQVRAAPTLILDNSVRWTGTVNMDEVVSIIRDRDPASLGADSVQALLENGAAEELARMMAGAGKIFPAFLDFLVNEKWPLRLGAMVAFEYLLEQDRDLAHKVIESLRSGFDKLDDGVKGDVLHLFGQSNGETMVEFLTAVLENDSSKDVREAAQEALASIRSRE